MAWGINDLHKNELVPVNPAMQLSQQHLETAARPGSLKCPGPRERPRFRWSGPHTIWLKSHVSKNMEKRWWWWLFFVFHVVVAAKMEGFLARMVVSMVKGGSTYLQKWIVGMKSSAHLHKYWSNNKTCLKPPNEYGHQPSHNIISNAPQFPTWSSHSKSLASHGSNDPRDHKWNGQLFGS